MIVAGVQSYPWVVTPPCLDRVTGSIWAGIVHHKELKSCLFLVEKLYELPNQVIYVAGFVVGGQYYGKLSLHLSHP